VLAKGSVDVIADVVRGSRNGLFLFRRDNAVGSVPMKAFDTLMGLDRFARFRLEEETVGPAG
jgi:hypothetical protein